MRRCAHCNGQVFSEPDGELACLQCGREPDPRAPIPPLFPHLQPNGGRPFGRVWACPARLRDAHDEGEVA